MCYFPFFISFRRAVSVDIFNAIRCYRPLRRAKDDVRSAMTMSLLSSFFFFFFFILLTLLAHTRNISGPWVFSSLPTPMRLILPLCTHPASAGNPSSTRDHAHANTVLIHSAYKLVDVLRTHCTDMQNAIEKGGRLFFSRALDHIFYFFYFLGFSFHRQRNREK